MNTVETFGYGITRSWLDEGRIALIVTEGNMARAAIDTWANLTIETMKNWAAGEPVRIAHDLTHRNQRYTIYGQKRVGDIFDSIPDDRLCYMSAAIADGPINRLGIVFLNRLPVRSNLKHKIFTSRAEAIRWLQEAEVGKR